MLSFLSKKKIKEEHVARVFVSSINELTLDSFPLIAEHLNHLPELQKSPNIKAHQTEWFLFIVFAANIKNLNQYFSDNQLNRIRILVIDEFIESLEGIHPDVILDNINIYQDYLNGLEAKCDGSLPKTIATAMFYKYGLDKCQNEHFTKINEVNPILIKSICEITADFIWNWNDLLEKYKMVA